MSFNLTKNFLTNARGFQFADGGGATWSFDKNTNTLSLAVSGTGIVPGSIVNADLANMAASTIKGNATGSPAAPQDLSVATTKTLLSLNLVENTALSTWAGSANLTTVGTISSGVWQGTAVDNSHVTATLTGKTYNGLTLTAQAVGFTIAGGTTPETLTVGANASVSGTNTGDQTLPLGGNPTGNVGLAAVNGTAVTWMRSDGAPALNVGIVPTWTGAHTFNATVAFRNTASTISWFGAGAQFGVGIGFVVGQTELITTSTALGIGSAGATALNFYTNSVKALGFDILQKATFAAAIGWNGATPPAQVTGFGTPTGPSVVANFSGTAATNAQMQATIAQILTIMKAHGMLGA